MSKQLKANKKLRKKIAQQNLKKVLAATATSPTFKIPELPLPTVSNCTLLTSKIWKDRDFVRYINSKICSVYNVPTNDDSCPSLDHTVKEIMNESGYTFSEGAVKVLEIYKDRSTFNALIFCFVHLRRIYFPYSEKQFLDQLGQEEYQKQHSLFIQAVFNMISKFFVIVRHTTADGLYSVAYCKVKQENQPQAKIFIFDLEDIHRFIPSMLSHDRTVELDAEDNASWNLPSLPVSYLWVQHELFKTFNPNGDKTIFKDGVATEIKQNSCNEWHEYVKSESARVDRMRISQMYISIPERIREAIQAGLITNLTELKRYNCPEQWLEIYNFYTCFQAAYHPTDDYSLFSPLLHFYAVKPAKIMDAPFVSRLIDQGEVEDTRKGSSIFSMWRSKERLNYVRQLKNMDFEGYKKLLIFIV